MVRVRAHRPAQPNLPQYAAGLLLPGFTLLAACAPPRPRAPEPPPRPGFTMVADSLIHISELNSAHWGIEVYDPARDQLLYSYDAARHFIPASNTKLVVTSVAMGTLGPDWRYRTEIVASETAGGNGSTPARVIVLSRGDPTWSKRYHPSDLTVLELLADSLAAKGIRSAGELIIDASFFGPERVHGTWEVGDLPFASGAATGSFAIAEGMIQLEARPGAQPGDAAHVRLAGPGGVFPVRARVTTDTVPGASISVDFQSWPDTIVVSGRIGVRSGPDTTNIAAPNPTRYAAAAFAEALLTRNVEVRSIRIVYDSTEARELRAGAPRVLASWTSVPLSQVVAGILQPSQNWIAEQLLRTLGGLQRGRGTWATGIEVERRFLIETVGLDSTSFQLRDASGLSAQNLLSPRAIVQLLEYDRRAPWAALYRAALPTPGMRESTLQSRLPGLEGKVFAKTGTITNVATLSGYVITRSGRELVFSIMVNSSGRSSAQVRRGIDRLVVALAEARGWD